MRKTRSIEELLASNFVTGDELRAEIKKRQEIMGQMSGDLYPGILARELEHLELKLKGEWFPEHRKLAEFHTKTSVIAEFLEFADTKNISLGFLSEEKAYLLPRAECDALMYEWIGVDGKKLEAEKVQMIAAQRKANEKNR